MPTSLTLSLLCLLPVAAGETIANYYLHLSETSPRPLAFNEPEISRQHSRLCVLADLHRPACHHHRRRQRNRTPAARMQGKWIASGVALQSRGKFTRGRTTIQFAVRFGVWLLHAAQN